ncbi:hypothetical protein J6590_036159 [Homalodisca vitripennis]|nr:hypothetical protein J6590_036159 [Homalodisca vitripennis]
MAIASKKLERPESDRSPRTDRPPPNTSPATNRYRVEHSTIECPGSWKVLTPRGSSVQNCASDTSRVPTRAWRVSNGSICPSLLNSELEPRLEPCSHSHRPLYSDR